MTLALLFCLLCQPFLASDLAILRSQPYEYAIVYSADYTQRVETTDHNPTSVSIWQYSRMLRNGGHAMHSHPTCNGCCPSFSYPDIEIAMELNLADTEVVSRGVAFYAIRGAGGWKMLSEATFWQTVNRYGRNCAGVDRAWQFLAKKYGFSYGRF